MLTDTIDLGRRWIADSAIGITAHGADTLTEQQVIDIVGHAYEGGWPAFVADAQQGQQAGKQGSGTDA